MTKAVNKALAFLRDGGIKKRMPPGVGPQTIKGLLELGYIELVPATPEQGAPAGYRITDKGRRA